MLTIEPRAAPSAGAISFHYTISTPTCASASAIDPALPTLLFLHSVYGDQVMLHCQFADCNVRRYNCVAVDLREHGLTKNAPVPEGYGVREGAEDVAAFMDALELPPCHVVGTSMGTIHGVALAVHYPDKVKSLFLISPLCTEEPEFVKDGRREITEIWEEGMRQEPPDEVMLKDSVFGVTQMALSGMPTDGMMNAMISHTLSIIMSRWTPPRFPSFERVTLDFFCDKGDFDLTGINPALQVFMVHGVMDIAYSTEMVLAFRKQLEDAGVSDVVMVDLENAPQYPWVGTHARAVNGLLVDFVARVEGRSLPVPQGVASPWADELRTYGWEAHSGEGGNEDDEDEDEVQIVYH